MLRIYKILVLLYCFSTVGFFQPLNLISTQSVKFLSYVFLLMLFILPKFMNEQCDDYNEKIFERPLLFLIICVAISVFMPVLCGKSQSFTTGIVATIPYFSYGLYFSFHKSYIDVEFFVKLIYFMAILSMATYIINRLTFPTIVFGVEREYYDYSRGGLRLNMIGFSYIIFSYVLSLCSWKETKDKKYLFFAILAYIFIFISYTRQHIIIGTIIGVVICLQSYSVLNKFFCVLIFVLSVIFFLCRSEPVQNIVKATENQIEKNKEKNRADIRIQSILFFGIEDYEYKLQRFFGHGIPSFHSQWGKKQQMNGYLTGMYKEDVGIFGMAWNFGLFAVIFYMVIIVKAIKQSWQPGKYIFFWLLCVSATSAPMLYQYQIFIWIMMLYVIDKKQK